MEEKVSPYLRPLYDALHDMMDFEKADQLLARGLIEVAPIAFMRGRTLNDAFVILDEAQNTTAEQMKMFLTRLGFESKAVITGDVTQIDLPDNRRSGLNEAIDLLSNIHGIAFRYFTEVDVVRHPLVQQIIKAYDAANAAKLRTQRLPIRVIMPAVTQAAEAQSADRAATSWRSWSRRRARSSSERDIRKLLAVILEKCRQVTGADAGSVYVVEEEGGSEAEYKPAPKKLPALHAVAERLDRRSTSRSSSLDDRRQVDRRPGGADQAADQHPRPDRSWTRARQDGTLRHNRSFDEKTGYRARSMLTVPMLSAMGEVIGVVQLINKRRDPGPPARDRRARSIPFDQRSEELALALGGDGGHRARERHALRRDPRACSTASSTPR